MKYLQGLFIIFVVFGLPNISIVQSYEQHQTPLTQETDDFDTTSIIVQLKANTPVTDLRNLSPELAASQQVSIQRVQQQLLRTLNLPPDTDVIQYQYLPYIALQADDTLLQQLMTSDQVVQIYKDIPYELTLENSSAFIGATNAWSAGYDGSDQIVVIIDSGVDASHPFFGGRIIQEACFSLSGQVNGQTYTSNCPNGTSQQFGPGAAAPCNGNGCYHGTHVAGIAAGSNASFSGVARNASIIAVQVTSNTPGCGNFLQPLCGTPHLSTVVQAMDWLYALQIANPDYDIAAVNLSLGSPNIFTKTCDTVYQPQTDAVNLLRSIGIVTIAGTGNGDQSGQGYVGGISLPSCITSIVSVGSTSADPGTTDQVSTFSNSANFIDLLAPGLNINSSMPGGSYSSQSGTSMATPQVTGAWALMRDAMPNATIDQILAALKATGTIVTDTRNGVIAPRIQVDTAITELLDGTHATLYDVVINEVRTQSQQAVEIYNAGSVTANLTGWRLQILGANGSIERDYAFPNGYTIPAGEYRVIQRGSGSTANTLYMGSYSTSWGANGAVRLTNGDFGIDFMRWGNATISPGVGTGWTGTNPPAPANGQTIGRDTVSTDFDDATDWTSMPPTFNSINQIIRPANDDFSNASIMTSLPYTSSVNNRNATLQLEEENNLLPDCASVMNNTVWYRYDSSSTETLRIGTRGSDFDTALAVWTDIFTTPQQIACNDDITTGTLPQSEIVLTTAPGEIYYIQVGGYGGSTGLIEFQVDIGDASDNRAGAKVINSLPYSDQMNTDLTSASQDDPQPSCNTDPVQNTVWYRYSPTENEFIHAQTAGSDFDTVLSLWADNAGTLTEVACHDDVSLFFDFTSTVDSPLVANTTYYFMISGAAAGYSGNLVFEVTRGIANAPVLNSPENGATTSDSTPLLSWQGVSEASSYQVQIDDQSNFSSPIQDVTQSQLNYLASTLADDTYYWRVRGRNAVSDGPWSMTYNFIIDTSVPILTGPADNSTTLEQFPIFTWEALANVDYYEIQISLNNPPTGATIEVNSVSYQPESALLPTVYYWRVRAINEVGVASDWSSIWSLAIISDPEDAPGLNFYTDGDINLTWLSVSWATGYHIQISRLRNFASLIYDNDLILATAMPNVTPPTLSSGAYFWRVRAKQSNGLWGRWSAADTFIVED